MDANFEKMTNGLNKLLMLIEAEKSAVSDSQTHIIDEKYFEEVQGHRNEIDKLTELQTTGWKRLYPEEKISGSLRNVLVSFKNICFCLIKSHVSDLQRFLWKYINILWIIVCVLFNISNTKFLELLHQRGLKILHSGHLINDEGQVITFKEAKASKLFNHLGPDALKEIKANLLSEDDDDETIQTGKWIFYS